MYIDEETEDELLAELARLIGTARNVEPAPFRKIVEMLEDADDEE
jgi:hypothetical protein